MTARTFTAFQGDARLAGGPLAEVATAVRAASDAAPEASFVTFDDATGRVVDLDLRGDAAEIAARYAEATPAPARGRPKLGVVPREVTLLPRHWDWLARQQGGASATLRRLVDEARREDAGRSAARAAQAAAYAFISAMAGDREGFEEASRALFAGDRARFAAESRTWPADIRAHAERMLDRTTQSEKPNVSSAPMTPLTTQPPTNPSQGSACTRPVGRPYRSLRCCGAGHPGWRRIRSCRQRLLRSSGSHRCRLGCRL